MSTILNPRQVAQRIRHGSLPAYSDDGNVRCACHPDNQQNAQTESLRFWATGDYVTCAVSKKAVPAMPYFPALDLFIDTRRS
jgi:hypothetical protein